MRFKYFATFLGMALLAGCLGTEEGTANRDPIAGSNPGKDSTRTVFVRDSTALARKLDSVMRVNDSLLAAIKKDTSGIIRNPDPNGGWDDFPNKYRPTLVELAKLKLLPVPLGTRYDLTPAPLGKTGNTLAASSGRSVAENCPRGQFELFIFRDPARELLVQDTIVYYDTADAPHCSRPGGSYGRETHARYVLDMHSGESWEKIEIKLTDQDVMPRQVTHGTGRIRLNNGMEFRIQSHDVTMLTQFDSKDAIILDAGMRLTYKEAYAVKLDLVKPHPYKALDFFPLVGALPDAGKIMSGPILHNDTTVVGYLDLYADRSVAVRDWKGEVVAP